MSHPSAVRRALLAAAALLLPACAAPVSGGEGNGAAPSASLADLGHVHDAVLDPGGDGVLLGTHTGLVRVHPDGRVEAVGPVLDLMGFTAAAPDRFLASGHPGLHSDLPQPMGLIESTDGGRTWEPLSRQGESDFHALTVGAAGVLGYDGTLRRSDDGKRWEELSIPAQPAALAAAGDGRVLATTAEGLLASPDDGETWSAVPDAPLLQVVDWAGDGGSAVGVDPAGQVWLGTADGTSWERGADLGEAPQALAAGSLPGGEARVVVVTGSELLESSDGGRSFSALPVG